MRKRTPTAHLIVIVGCSLSLVPLVVCRGAPSHPAGPAEGRGPDAATRRVADAAPPPRRAPDAGVPRARPDAAAPAPRTASTQGPLATWERQAFAVAERETLKPIASKDRYVRSNETELQLFAPHVTGLGQGYVGVGADQNYTLMAMAGTAFGWMMDYDPWVARLHKVYQAVVIESATADDLIALWPQKDKVLAALRKHFPDATEQAEVIELYQKFVSWLKPYLGWSWKRKRLGQGTTWLSNPGYYQHIRRLFQEGRIQALPGDLHGVVVLRAIGAAARRLGLAIRIVYLSNAEMYLPYSKSFIATMQSLPVDERSVLVRTVRGGGYPMLGDNWHYNVQPFQKDYVRRLSTGRYHGIFRLMGDLDRAPHRVRQALMQPKGFSRFTDEVPALAPKAEPRP
jgi:hypothetical protein